MTTADNALQTTTQRQMGINQPRPEATLHVGGTFIADGLATFRGGLSTGGGALTLDSLTVGTLTVTGTTTVSTLNASGDIKARYLHTTDGSNGIVYADNGDLYFRGPGSYRFDSGGAVFMSAALTSGVHTMAGGYSSGRVSIVYADGQGVGWSGGSGGQLEIQSSSGAAMIAFHRSGAFAAYFGVDTDNQWKVGGWSMGGASYVLITDTQTQTLRNKVIAWRYDYNTSGVMSYYNCFYVLPVNGGVWTLPTSAGHAGEMIICKNWAGAAGTVQAPGGSIIGTIPGGVASVVLQPGDSYTFMSDGGAGWMVV